MALRDRFSRIFRDQQPTQVQRPEVPASHQRTVSTGYERDTLSEFGASTPLEWGRQGRPQVKPKEQAGFHTDRPWDSNAVPDDGRTPSIPIQATSSSNPTRPRTYQAGWDAETKTLRVVYRDGTYDYHDVDETAARLFINSWSPGRMQEALHLTGHRYERIS